MIALTSASLLALKSLTHGRLLRIFVAGLFLNAAVLGLLVVGVYQLVHHFTDLGWLDWMIEWGVTGISAFIAYLIFPLLLPLIISFFDDAIANATEAVDYPDIPTPQPPFWPTLGQDATFTAKAIALNLLVLPLYLLPLINILFYYVLNGYLLGREFFHVVAGRHMTREQAEAHWKKHRLSMIACGILVAFCATLPIINLMTPVWAVVMMTHFFHRTKPHYKAMDV